MHTDQHDGSIDQEANPYQHGDINIGFAGRVEPIHHDAGQCQQQINDADGCTSATKKLVR